LPEQGEIWQSWDIALRDGINNDYSVCITAKQVQNLLYLIDIWREKLELNDLVNKIHSMNSDFKTSHVIIEESSVSIHTLQIIRQYGEISPYPYIPEGSKKVRANNAAYYIREGRVLIPAKARWLPDFMNEINAFPFGKHDDQVDALSQLIKVVFDRQCTINDIAQAINHSKTGEKQFNSAKAMCLYAKSKIGNSWENTMRGGNYGKTIPSTY
jgi:predicted phage terminase large subunit-like protein